MLVTTSRGVSFIETGAMVSIGHMIITRPAQHGRSDKNKTSRKTAELLA